MPLKNVKIISLYTLFCTLLFSYKIIFQRMFYISYSSYLFGHKKKPQKSDKTVKIIYFDHESEVDWTQVGILTQDPTCGCNQMVIWGGIVLQLQASSLNISGIWVQGPIPPQTYLPPSLSICLSLFLSVFFFFFLSLSLLCFSSGFLPPTPIMVAS